MSNPTSKNNLQKRHFPAITPRAEAPQQQASYPLTHLRISNKGKVDLQHLNHNNILQLQRIVGNRAVMRLLSDLRSSGVEPQVNPSQPRPTDTLSVNCAAAANQIQRAKGLPTSEELREEGIKPGKKKTKYRHMD